MQNSSFFFFVDNELLVYKDIDTNDSCEYGCESYLKKSKVLT